MHRIISEPTAEDLGAEQPLGRPLEQLLAIVIVRNRDPAPAPWLRSIRRRGTSSWRQQCRTRPTSRLERELQMAAQSVAAGALMRKRWILFVDLDLPNQVVTGGGVYHRLCLSCSECHRVVQDAGQAKKGPEGGIYCPTCYERQFGHTGRASMDSRIVMAPNGKVFSSRVKFQFEFFSGLPSMWWCRFSS